MAKSKLWRQKRRILFVVAGAMLSYASLMGPGIGAVVSGVGAGIFAGVVIVFLPWLRTWMETAALGFTLASLMPIRLDAYPLLAVSLSALFALLIYSRWSNRLPLRFSLTSRREALIDQPANKIWSALVPGASHPDDYWSGNLIDFDHDPDDPDTLYLRFETGDRLPEEMSLTFIEHTPFSNTRYLLEKPAEDGHDDVTVTLELVKAGPGKTSVSSMIEQDGLPLRIALKHWFDDTFAEELSDFASASQTRRQWQVAPRAVAQTATTPPLPAATSGVEDPDTSKTMPRPAHAL